MNAHDFMVQNVILAIDLRAAMLNMEAGKKCDAEFVSWHRNPVYMYQMLVLIMVILCFRIGEAQEGLEIDWEILVGQIYVDSLGHKAT